MIEKYSPDGHVEDLNPNDELYVQEVNFQEEFFLDVEQDLQLETNYLLNNYNMTQFEINVASEGVNIFDIAI